MPIYSKSARCFPNECYICKSRDNLKRCECNMISYCSEDHRQQHLSTHEDFCKVVKELLKIKGIHHELIGIYDDTESHELTTKNREIRKQIIKKLKRNFSPLENFMFYSPRICFNCHETKQKYLINCPHCPVASFCFVCKNHKTHDEFCKVMNTYLKVLTTAEEFKIDLGFLSSFPFTGEEYQIVDIDYLTMTYGITGTNIFGMPSKLRKIFLINFIDFASKINNALQKIYLTIPEELTIHIDHLTYDISGATVNYWEFLLHLYPRIKKLKIVMTTIPDPSGLKTSLCKNCHSEGRNFILEASLKSYEDYMLDENYQEPDILFYLQINIKTASEEFNKWSELNCSIILQFDSNSNFCKAQQFLSSSRAKFRFIFGGKLAVPFATLSSIENEDYFIILQSKGDKKLQKSVCSTTGEINKKTNTPTPSTSKRYAIAIFEPEEEEEGEKNEKSKTENCKNSSKSINKEYFEPNVEEEKIEKKDVKVNSSPSYLIEHISYLKNENEGLRQQLNLSVNEVTKLQTKLDQVSIDLSKKNTLINKILRNIVDTTDARDTELEDTDSLCENNNV
ncbi:uncharacterized protein LOC122505309 [Leptopilina heterotoma]|uniref:uncharacterized protein LOC122505309 n=1 Tax=Leptopilina heterotoma TaxID=63436 RepID=UPI001CA90CB9|nr:uncharacterized protein LOC122505309 [Leptopilina heterotoma]